MILIAVEQLDTFVNRHCVHFAQVLNLVFQLNLLYFAENHFQLQINFFTIFFDVVGLYCKQFSKFGAFKGLILFIA